MSSGLTIRDGDILARDLVDQAEVTGPGFRMLQPAHPKSEAVLHGDHRISRLRNGLSVHTSDTVALADLATTVEQAAGLSVIMFLSGKVEAYIGDLPLEVSGGPGEPVRAVLVARARPDRFVRRVRKGEKVRKIVVTVTPEWLAETELPPGPVREAVLAFQARHLARFSWTASPALVAIANQLLHPPQANGYPETLYLESRAVEVLAEAFAHLAAGTTEVATPLSGPDMRRLRIVEDAILAAGPDGPPSLGQLARQSGISVSTMQRLFRSAFNMTVTDYIRKSALARARQLLERDGVSVAQAAHASGYSSAANFATAFKREFGMTPREARGRARH